MKRRAPARLNALSVAKMIAYWQDVPSNVNELAEASGLAVPTTRRFVLALERERAIRVVGWEQDRLGRYVTKVYAFGPGKDAPKPPKARSRNQVRREWRARQKQQRMQGALTV